ncbi:GreA/GreB family elongation factor [Ectothiorhodospiraceae bacterium WFHF3C12]|nr:GreA/GreB family elongation factor [Ectothiorhodospiraceae bacterium WFHF3C12]
MTEQLTPFSSFDVERLESLLSRSDLNAGEGHVTELAARLYARDQAEPASIPPDVVTMNSEVMVKELSTGKGFSCTLVFPRNADSGRRRISVLAPLGAALLGARVGSTVEVRTPAGSRRYRVTELLFQPEAAGRFDL